MSGDVQPRRRKDKKRKRDDRKSEGEVIFSRKQSLQEDDESSHGVHSANMGVDDQHIHVHEDHGTGGNWYQKCAFLVLMAILLGLVGLIIVENRGLADLDTPLSESRYSDYLHGWVEEHREEHDDHDEVEASLEEHDEHDEPYEEEEDHSEAEEEEDEEEHDDEHDDDDDEEDDDHDKDGDVEDASEEVTAEQTKEVDDDEEDEDEDEDDDDENNNDDDDEEVAASQVDDEDDDDDEAVVSNEADDDNDNATNEDDDDENAPQTAEDDDDGDNDDDDNVAANDDDDDDNDDEDENNTEEEATAASLEADDNKNDDGDDDEDDDDDDDNNNQADDNDASVEPSHQASANRHSKDSGFDDPFDEEDDDATAESFESMVVDNDAEEKLLLKEKERRWAEQNQPPKDDKDDDEPEEANSFFANLAVKFGVGVALALVARFVLMRKNPNTHAEPSAEDLMKRRLTISSAEVTYPEDEDATPLSEDEEQHISDEELDMEEEIEYVEEEEEIEIELDENDQEIPSTNKYVPETFEDFSAMYRPKTSVVPESSSRVEELKTTKALREEETPITMKKSAAVFTAPPPPPLVEAKIEPKQHTAGTKVSFSSVEPVAASKPTEITTREVTHDIDFQPDEDDIDYTDTDEEYDEDEEIVEEEQEEIEDLLDDDGSDVDDTELMNRLEAKYGRLPSNEYESDEDPEDPTWTQIKPKQTPGGGPQTQEDDYHSIYNKIRHEPNPNIYEDDEYEREMAFANDELLRGNHIGALVAYFRITHNYPDRPMGFLRKAKLSHQLAIMKDDTGFKLQSVDAFKRYLAFDDLITNNAQLREAAEECIEIMRDIGQFEPAITIHRILMNHFPHDPELRNQMVITLLMMDRYYDAKLMLLETHKKWPKNGLMLTLLGYVLKTHDANYTGAAHYLHQGIESNAKLTQDARFYIALGESYERLGKHEASLEIYKRGAELKLYPSAYQRSVYNELNLRAQPTWTEEQTTHTKNFKEIAIHWQVIRDEALEMLEGGGYFRKETENLVVTGNWKELELFSRGVRNQRNCQRAPTTCWLIDHFPAAANCRRGQVKFSVMHPGTHVRAHCGPTNCRLRAHLGLIVPTGTKLRVASQIMSWTEGAFLIFDDSFEHEVWHDGAHLRLVLIVDFWHPDLGEKQIESLSTI